MQMKKGVKVPSQLRNIDPESLLKSQDALQYNRQYKYQVRQPLNSSGFDYDDDDDWWSMSPNEITRRSNEDQHDPKKEMMTLNKINQL